MTDCTNAHPSAAMRAAAPLLILMMLVAAPARAQDSSVLSPAVPASVAIQLRNELELDDVQMAKLRELGKVQTAALTRTTAAFLRAEADVLDAARGEDPIVRRTALEKRAKVAIDAEIARLKWDKDVRAVLNQKQIASFTKLSELGGAKPVLWRALVAPTQMALSAEPAPDSGEVRISVSPVYADIYVAGEKRGTGRRFMNLPVGKHELRFHAVGCTELVVPVEVVKGPPIIISQSLTCGK
jgi:hypothetical protein